MRRGEQPRVSVLERVAEGRSQVEGRAFQAHGHAAAEGGDPRDHSREQGSEWESVGRVVEGVKVLVGGGGRGRWPHPAQGDRGDAQPDERSHRDRPQRKAIELFEAAGDGAVESGDTEAGCDADDGCQEDDFA